MKFLVTDIEGQVSQCVVPVLALGYDDERGLYRK